MSIPILDKSVVKEEDPINMDAALNKILKEDECEERKEGNECEERKEGDEYTREKIIAFIKNEGFSYKEGPQDVEDETSDLFTKNDKLIEMIITSGVDKNVLDEIMKE